MLTLRPRLHGAAESIHRQQLEIFWLKLELLLEGARRHARPFGLTGFNFEDPHDNAMFVAENRGRIRTCDAIGETNGGVLVAWDEAGRDLAEAAAERLVRSTATCRPIEVATAVFPDDGLTISALIEALHAPDASLRLLGDLTDRHQPAPAERWVDPGAAERAS